MEGEESTLDSFFFFLNFIVHRLKAMSRASQNGGIDFFSTEDVARATSESLQTRLRDFNIMFCSLVSKSNFFHFLR